MTSRIFSYSNDNPYARDYYLACKKFDNIQNEIIKFENSNNPDKNPVEYEKLQREFAYWDNEVPRLSNKAGEEEQRLQAQKKDASKNGETIDFLG